MRNIHLITCSNQVDAIQLVEPVISDLENLEKGVTMYDEHLKREILVIAPVILGLHDNPRASETTNHLGSAANLFCRMCMVSCIITGVPDGHGLVGACYKKDIFQCDKRFTPQRLGVMKTKAKALAQIEIIKQATERQRKDKQTLYGLSERYNPLFQLTVDLFRYFLYLHAPYNNNNGLN